MQQQLCSEGPIIINFHFKIGRIGQNVRQSKTVACCVVLFPWQQNETFMVSGVVLTDSPEEEIPAIGSLWFDPAGNGKVWEGSGGYCWRMWCTFYFYQMKVLSVTAGMFLCLGTRYWCFLCRRLHCPDQSTLIAGWRALFNFVEHWNQWPWFLLEVTSNHYRFRKGSFYFIF